MSAFLFAWALVATVASFVVLAVVVAAEIRDHRAQQQRPEPAPVPRIPAQRQPTAGSAAAVVVVHDAESFDRFLAELIVTPHVETALS